MNLKNSYEAKDIEVLEGLEPVRKRPGMYIGGTDAKAIHHLAFDGWGNRRSCRFDKNITFRS